MLRFTTISPTHIEGKGKKRKAWERFRDGGYVAIGWLGDTNLTGKSPSDLVRLIENRKYGNETEAKDCLSKFLFGLSVGDYIAVNNVNHGLFGIGRITSQYKFKLHKHEAGDGTSFYSHYRKVRWLQTEYANASNLLRKTDSAWRPRGTMGAILESLPPYARRFAVIQKDLERITSNSIESALEKSFSSGQGFEPDPIVKSVVEDYAVKSAVSHYQKLGYVVKERGKPYDLLCTKGKSQLFVEVKGSRTACREIILTQNEVKFAEKNVGKMQLFVLAKISVRRVADDCTACGGKEYIMPWTIDRTRLTPLQFSYKLPDFS